MATEFMNGAKKAARDQEGLAKFQQRQFESETDLMKRYNLNTDLKSRIALQREMMNSGFTHIEAYLEHKLGPAPVEAPNTHAERVEYRPNIPAKREEYKPVPDCSCGGYGVRKPGKTRMGSFDGIPYMECSKCGWDLGTLHDETRVDDSQWHNDKWDGHNWRLM